MQKGIEKKQENNFGKTMYSIKLSLIQIKTAQTNVSQFLIRILYNFNLI